MEHPEDRTEFRHDELLKYVRADRPRFYCAAMRVLRGYIAAGMPPHGASPKGSFEPWDRLVRGAIIWAGGADPLAGVKRIRDAGDEDLDKQRALLIAWYGRLGAEPVTITEGIKRAGDVGALHDAMAAYCRSGRLEPGASKALGYVFKAIKGRIAGGLRLERAGEDRNGTVLWRALTVAACDKGHAGDVYPKSDFRNETAPTAEQSPASHSSPAVRHVGLHGYDK